MSTKANNPVMKVLNGVQWVGMITLLSVLSACDDDKPDPPVPQPPTTAVVKMTYEPVWGDQPFDKTNVYLSAADERVLIQLVKMYISEVELIQGADTQRVSSAELVDVTNGPTVRYASVRAGTYSDLHFALGLPYELNHGDITTIDPNAPLGNNSGMYWTWATLYRFLLFEGRYDTDPNATSVPPYQFSLHTGRDQCYRPRVVPFPTTTVPGDTIQMNFRMDIERFFTNGSAVLDLSQGPQSHGEASTLPIAMELSDLVIQAIDVE